MADTAPIDKSPFSQHFNKLKLMGAWVVKTPDGNVVGAYAFYKTVMTIIAVSACFSLFYDLYLVFGDFKKMTWNLCVSTLFSASLIKNLVTINKSGIIDRMRVRLHRDANLRTAPENDSLHQLSRKELRCIQVFFYGLAGIFIPTWLGTFYARSFRYSKEMPIPMRLPIHIDTEDEFQFNVAFWALGMAGVMGITLILETELAMFTILVQITREYRMLLNDIPKLNELYESNAVSDEGVEHGKYLQEVNPLLRKSRTKSLVKEYLTRQQKLIEYTEEFEMSYSPALLVHVFALTLLIVVSAIQCILEFGNLSMDISYQMGYICILMMDMFLVCCFSTRLRMQCLQVGQEAYSTLWYRMSSDIQKDICMIIMRSQHPPKITSGKVMELNLHAFMLTLRNVYSWLTLFKQLAQKVN